MPTRQIVYLSDNQNIKKIVPTFEELHGKKFPTLGELDDWDSARERIYELLQGSSLLCHSAVVQQYNELIIASNCSIDNVIAPINFISTDERNIPILGFPRFTPLVPSENFYKYNDEECLVELGMAAQRYNINFNKVRKFMDNIKDLCIDFDLREDDILNNLSNIGYNKEYGLCVLDYGLVNSLSSRKFELVNL